MACLELIAVLCAPEAGALKAAIASTKAESALLARATAVLSTTSDARAPPIAGANASMRAAMNELAVALKAPDGVTADR
eukprot:CAMPEP_0119392662 /NCGR_PEP_ID=MMETSP1334-20130426/122042_1 /TAXON_ID=127549 /ORGANISM="Calcidiscus leptoporus, Strain RCC1130" /LENGTH=78 /DNA_ID=CAMNT_0007415549 /DNA_START=1 /DNA_END=234 /DNA_ORIENTATION=-